MADSLPQQPVPQASTPQVEANEPVVFTPALLAQLDTLPLHYCRYYVGHMGRYGHEFLEFEIRADGTLRYNNHSKYRGNEMIKKEMCLSPLVLNEIKRLIVASTIFDQDDSKWPEPDRGGRQELECLIGECHISFTANKIGLQTDAERYAGLLVFHCLVNDLKTLIFSLARMHFKINPV